MTDTQVITNECWRSISGFLNYQVSNIGRVRNSNTGRIMKLSVGKDGYRRVGLTNSEGQKLFLVHKLVANEFIEKPVTDTRLCVDHIDHNRTNNQITNLRWVTFSQNQMNSTKSAKPKSSIYKGVTWLNREQKWVAQVRLNKKPLFYKLFDSEKDAARAYNEKAVEFFGEYAHTNDVPEDDD